MTAVEAIREFYVADTEAKNRKAALGLVIVDTNPDCVVFQSIPEHNRHGNRNRCWNVRDYERCDACIKTIPAMNAKYAATKRRGIALRRLIAIGKRHVVEGEPK